MPLVIIDNFDFNLFFKYRKLIQKLYPVSFSYGHAVHLRVSPVYETAPLVKAEVEATNYCSFTELKSKFLYFVDFISDVVSALLHEV